MTREAAELRSSPTTAWRLVTFLGTSDYQPACYAFPGKPASEPTRWIALALNRLLDPQPTRTLVVATEQAARKNFQGLKAAFRQEGLAEPECVIVPEGRTVEELWQQFEVLKSLVRGDGQRTAIARGTEVVVDITHSLRHQPFFAAGVLSFVRMVDEEPPSVRVVYGAWELRTSCDGLEVSPIIELTAFADLVDWTHDLILFLKSGRLGKISERVGQIRRRRGDPSRHADELGRLAKALERFTRDLQTIRTGSLLLGSGKTHKRSPSSARNLVEVCDAGRRAVAARLPPLADVLDRIREMAAQLVFDGDALVGPRARDVLANLAALYLHMGRYVEALTTVREACISLAGPPAIACPGFPDYDHQLRQRRGKEAKNIWPQIFNNLAQFRNDIDHAGFQPQINPPKTLIGKAEEAVSALRAMEDTLLERFAAGQLEGETERVPTRFANISHHPSAEWSEEQRRGALALASEIVDIRFPEVPPAADREEIEELAQTLVRSLPRGVSHALVQGEFTLTFAIVRELQQDGECCLAATTERSVEPTPDGRFLRGFRFVRFRPYPPLVAGPRRERQRASGEELGNSPGALRDEGDG